MNFGSFEAQPEHLLPKHRPGSRSFEDLLVPYGGEDIRKVGQRVLKTVLERAEEHTKDGAEILGIVIFVFMIITKDNWSFFR